MARIASQSKGGFYATPIEEIELILSRMTIRYTDEDKVINIIDPCCGEGEALERLARHLRRFEPSTGVKTATYGVELEKSRGETAATVLNHVVNESFENVRTDEKYGLMWLNPPYDKMFNERTELRFLRHLTSKSKNVLQQNGLLMLCIPQYVLADVASTVGTRFKDVKVYRFTDENYPVFKQVVLFGYFRVPTIAEQKDTIAMLKELAEVDPAQIPTLAEIQETFIVPSNKDEIQLFRAGRMNIEELAQDLASSPLFAEFEDRVVAKANRTIMKRPILPLKTAHAAIAVASGAVGGNFGNHIVTGVTKPAVNVTPIENEDGEVTGEKVSRYYTSAVRVFTHEGVHELN